MYNVEFRDKELSTWEFVQKLKFYSLHFWKNCNKWLVESLYRPVGGSKGLENVKLKGN